MSYILAALNKAERERQAGSSVGASLSPAVPTAVGRPWWVVLLVSMLGSALVLAMYLLWQGLESASAPSVPTAPVTGTEAVVSAESAKSVTPPVAASAVPVAAVVPPSPSAEAVPLPTLRGMAEHAEPAATLPSEAPLPLIPVEVSTRVPGSVVWETAAAGAEPAPAAEPLPEQLAEIPVLHSLPATVRAQLPPLELNVHVYSDAPARRFVYINSERCVEGTQLEGGVVLERIIPNGVVLRQGALLFRLLLET